MHNTFKMDTNVNNSNCLRFIIDTVIKHIAQEVLTNLDGYSPL